MNKKVLKILITLIVLLLVFTIIGRVKAADLNIDVKASDFLYNLDRRADIKERRYFGVGEDIIFTVHWDKAMQATGFEIECENALTNEMIEESDLGLKFEGASIDEDFYEISEERTTDGRYNLKIKVEWASLEEQDKTSIDFIIRPLRVGEISFDVKKVTAFANGNLEIPETYNLKSASRTVFVDYFGDFDGNGELGKSDYYCLKNYLGLSVGEEEPLDIEAMFSYKEYYERVSRWGDLNIDGKIDLIDLDLLSKAIENPKIELPIIYGDINRDGRIDDKDVSLISQYCLGEQGSLGVITKQLSADLNNDGIVDRIDLYVLQRELSLGYLEFPVLFGDMDNDGRVMAEDVSVYTKYLNEHANLNLYQQVIGDLNLDSVVNSEDYEILLDYLNQRIAKIPVTDDKVLKLKEERDSTNKVIYSGVETEKEGLTKYSFVKKYVESNVSVILRNNSGTALTDKDVVGTGTRIFVTNESGATELGSLIIYGDTTGDGLIEAVDALALIKHINNKIPFTDSIYEKAGTILTSSNKKPTAIDALAIIKHANGKYTISQNKVN